MGKKAEVRLTVLRTEILTPSLTRVVLGGEQFATYAALHGDFTDTYVKLVFQTPDGQAKRTYTVRWVDRDAEELAIDFVTHGDAGLAGPWALAAVPGDELVFVGPSGGYRPRSGMDHHLFVGDEAALPAIGAAFEALPAGERATAFLEVDDADHELDLVTDADVTIHWLHRNGATPGSTTLLDDAVRAWPWPGGRVQAFVHGESALLKTVRRYLLDGRVERADISVSAYWKRGNTEEGFRSWKATQDDAVMRPDTEVTGR